MSAIGIHHAAVTVSSMEKSLEFYRDLLGLRLVDDETMSGSDISNMVAIPNARLRAVMLGLNENTPYVELIEYLHPRSWRSQRERLASDIGNSHFCFLVDSIHSEYERLSKAGVEFTAPPFMAEGGRFDGEWAAYCYDPDGFIVELWSHNK